MLSGRRGRLCRRRRGRLLSEGGRGRGGGSRGRRRGGRRGRRRALRRRLGRRGGGRRRRARRLLALVLVLLVLGRVRAVLRGRQGRGAAAEERRPAASTRDGIARDELGHGHH